MTKLFVLGLAVAVLAGCAPTSLCKPGGDFNRDMYDCQLRARQMAQFGNVYNPFVDVSEQRSCMEYKGWRPCSNEN